MAGDIKQLEERGHGRITDTSGRMTSVPAAMLVPAAAQLHEHETEIRSCLRKGAHKVQVDFTGSSGEFGGVRGQSKNSLV